MQGDCFDFFNWLIITSKIKSELRKVRSKTEKEMPNQSDEVQVHFFVPQSHVRSAISSAAYLACNLNKYGRLTATPYCHCIIVRNTDIVLYVCNKLIINHLFHSSVI